MSLNSNNRLLHRNSTFILYTCGLISSQYHSQIFLHLYSANTQVNRPTRASISLPAILSNLRLARSLTPHSPTIAVVKSDAYGHGAVRVAVYLDDHTDAFGTTSLKEALALRSAGAMKPILLLEGFFNPSEIPLIVEHQLWTTVHCEEQMKPLAEIPTDSRLRVFLKLDSGMHRLGIAPENYVSAYKYLSSLPQIEQVMLMSHFACADELDNPMTAHQLQLFEETIRGIEAPTSLANSPFILGWPVPSGDIIRPGLMLYGASPFQELHPNTAQLEAVMSFSTEVIAIREIPSGTSVGYGNNWSAERPSRIGTIALGYGDGYPRHAPSGTPVFIHGRQIPIVGRVSMDLVTVDLTELPNTKIGTEVEVFGQNLSINDVASWCGTIPHTLMTGLTSRVPRHYV